MTEVAVFCDRLSHGLPFLIPTCRYLHGFCVARREASSPHTIFEGTSEIQQLVIARAISGLRIE